MLPEGAIKSLTTGGYNAVASFLNFFLSPQGIATLGLGQAPAAVQKAVTAKYAVDMLRAAPDQMMAGIDAMERGDTMGAVENWLGGAGAAILGGALSAHTVAPVKVPTIREALQRGREFAVPKPTPRAAEGAIPPVIPTPATLPKPVETNVERAVKETQTTGPVTADITVTPESKPVPAERQAFHDRVGQIISEEIGADHGYTVIFDPELRNENGKLIGGLWQDGKKYINSAAYDGTAKGTKNLRAAIREEYAHDLINSKEGLVLLDDFMTKYKPPTDFVEELRQQGYANVDNAQLVADEYIAKQAREKTPIWTKMVDEVWGWIVQKTPGLKLTRAQAARAILRTLEQRKAKATGGRGIRLSLEEDPYRVDEKLIMKSPYTGDSIEVNYRGKPKDGQAVVWTGRTQMQIPEEWLSRPAGSPQTIARSMGIRFDHEINGRWQFTSFDNQGRQSSSFLVKAGATPEEIRARYEKLRSDYAGGEDQPRPLPPAAERMSLEDERKFQESAEDYFSRVSDHTRGVLQDFLAGSKSVAWKRVPADTLRKIWLEYGKRGTVSDLDGLKMIKERFLDNIARLKAITQLVGHTELSPESLAEEEGVSLTKRQWERFYNSDYITNQYSDYAFRYLDPLFEKIYHANTPDELMPLLDRVLNVVHQRGDIADHFVHGGSKTLLKIATQGGYEVPKEQLDQSFRRMALEPGKEFVPDKDQQYPEDQWRLTGRERPVTIERTDGTRYRAMVDDRFWPEDSTPPGLPSIMVHRSMEYEGKPSWSSGFLRKGEKIIEDTAEAASVTRYALTPEYQKKLEEDIKAGAPAAKHYQRAVDIQEQIEKSKLFWKLNPDKSWLENNKEYWKSVDPDAICQRSEGTDAAVNYLKQSLGKKYDSDMAWEVIARAQELGLKTPCPQCYVYSARAKPGSVMQKKYVVGVGGYSGELARTKDANLEQLSRTGLRHYSSTDFKAEHIPGLITEVVDAEAQRIPLQAYSKQGDLARIFAPAGMYINLSIGRNELIGMNMREAVELRRRYPTVGTIYVAFNDAEVIQALRNPNVDHVIPWHGSGQAMAELQAKLGDPTIKDYTAYRYKGTRGWYQRDTVNGQIAPKQVTDAEHKGDLRTYLQILKERGSLMRFPDIYDALKRSGELNLYMKLIGLEYGKYGEKYPYQPPVADRINYAAIQPAIRGRLKTLLTTPKEFIDIAKGIAKEVRDGTYERGSKTPEVVEGPMKQQASPSKQRMALEGVKEEDKGPFTVEWGTRAAGNQSKQFDTIREAQRFSKSKGRSADFVTIYDKNNVEVTETPATERMSLEGEKPEEREKPPWMMTLDEYVKKQSEDYAKHKDDFGLQGEGIEPIMRYPNKAEIADYVEKWLKPMHRGIIEATLKEEGKPVERLGPDGKTKKTVRTVPPEVLKDYPDLQKGKARMALEPEGEKKEDEIAKRLIREFVVTEAFSKRGNARLEQLYTDKTGDKAPFEFGELIDFFADRYASRPDEFRADFPKYASAVSKDVLALMEQSKQGIRWVEEDGGLWIVYDGDKKLGAIWDRGAKGAMKKADGYDILDDWYNVTPGELLGKAKTLPEAIKKLRKIAAVSEQYKQTFEEGAAITKKAKEMTQTIRDVKGYDIDFKLLTDFLYSEHAKNPEELDTIFRKRLLREKPKDAYVAISRLMHYYYENPSHLAQDFPEAYKVSVDLTGKQRAEHFERQKSIVEYEQFVKTEIEPKMEDAKKFFISRPWHLGDGVSMAEGDLQFYFPTAKIARERIKGTPVGEEITSFQQMFGEAIEQVKPDSEFVKKIPKFKPKWTAPDVSEAEAPRMLNPKNPAFITVPYGYSFDMSDLFYHIEGALKKGHDALIMIPEQNLPKPVLDKMSKNFNHPQYGHDEMLDRDNERLVADNIKKADLNKVGPYENDFAMVITFDRGIEAEGPKSIAEMKFMSPDDVLDLYNQGKITKPRMEELLRNTRFSLVTEKEAKKNEKLVKLSKDVSRVKAQLDFFDKEIGDALTSGGRFLEKEDRPEVAKGAPAEKGTMTNKAINQYFVDKLVTIRREMQRLKVQTDVMTDPATAQYFDVLQKRFELAFRQIQELRRASHEALYFWNEIRGEYQEIARMAGAMPDAHFRKPVLDQLWKDLRDKRWMSAGKDFVDYLRVNLFTPFSFTLDFTTNVMAVAGHTPAWLAMDLSHLLTGKPVSRTFTALRALRQSSRNLIPFTERFRLHPDVEIGLGTTAGGEFQGLPTEVMVDFSEILKNSPNAAKKLKKIDYVLGGPVRLKRSVDNFFGRFGAAADLYNSAYRAGKGKGLRGDQLKVFVEEFVKNPPEDAVKSAIKVGGEFKYNRELPVFAERFANNVITKLAIEAYPRWALQFTKWAGEMIGLDPSFARKVAKGQANAEEVAAYLSKAATGWGAIYAFNQLFYNHVDPNTMEYVNEKGERIRLSGRQPFPELFTITALLRGDIENAKAGFVHCSIPFAGMTGGQGGLLSPIMQAMVESWRGNYTAEQLARELTKTLNNAIPGKSMLGLIRSLYDPTIREGFGAPIPGIAQMLPQRVNVTTGEPMAPKQRIPGTGIEMPTVGGTPFPGAVRVMNPVERVLLNHGFGNVRPRRTSLLEIPVEEVPASIRQEYEQRVGMNVRSIIGEAIKTPEWQELRGEENFDVRRELLGGWMNLARSMAKAELAEKYGTGTMGQKPVPMSLKRLPQFVRQLPTPTE